MWFNTAMTEAKAKLILLVDDDEDIRDSVSYILKKAGYRVETAVDGEEGLRQIDALKPDLLILDLMLPRYGGFEVLRRLQSGASAGLPVIIVTGRYTDRATSELISQESNVVELMEKPVKANVLLSAIERSLAPRAAPEN